MMMVMMLIATIVIPNNFQYYRILRSTIVETCGSIMNYGGNICRIVVALLILKDKTGYSSLWQIDHCFLIFLRVARYAMVKLHEMNDLWSSHIGNLIIMNRYTHANQNGLITIPNKKTQCFHQLWIIIIYYEFSWIIMIYLESIIYNWVI